MDSKKSILINAGIFAAITVGYLAVTYYTTEPPPQLVSFESESLQTQLSPLNSQAGEPGQTITLKHFRGHNVLLHFWASWCESCEGDRKPLADLAKRVSADSMTVVGIATNDRREAITKSGKLKGADYAQYLDATGDLASALGVKSLPQTILIDSNGQIVERFTDALGVSGIQKIDRRIAEIGGLGTIPDFTLPSSLDKPLNRNALSRHVWVADFIFTSCPSFCPMLTEKMRQLQEKFHGDDRVRFVSFSVDPVHDTPAVLRGYGEKHGADPQKWFFLTGRDAEIKKLLVSGFKLGTMENPEFHTGKFVLVDQAQHIRGYYDADSVAELEKLKVDMAALLPAH